MSVYKEYILGIYLAVSPTDKQIDRSANRQILSSLSNCNQGTRRDIPAVNTV